MRSDVRKRLPFAARATIVPSVSRLTAIAFLAAAIVLPVHDATGDERANRSGAKQPKSQEAASKQAAKSKWIDLFDGKSLKGWNVAKFGGEGEVRVEDGKLLLPAGVDLTGVTIKDAKDLPRINYEIELDAMRVDGTDFFCGLTFPVKKDPCSLIIGGWGGGVCGLSSLDGLDASENETTHYREFENKKWYHIRLRVTEKKIQAWIDKKQFIDQDITSKKISIRFEVELSQPLGIASWQTTAALRNIRLRKLTDEEIGK
jgi:hypothetical protein